MAIEAKAVLLNRFESTLSNMLTANQMNDVLNALSIIKYYNLREQTNYRMTFWMRFYLRKKLKVDP